VEQAVRPIYQPAQLGPGVAVVRDIRYVGIPGQGPQPGISEAGDKQRLDLYLPPAWFGADRSGVPILVFVHGGSLQKGDKDLQVIGFDFYRNIGRFYSARGIAVGLVNYRLQPEVGWREQVEDVAAATAWIRQHAMDRPEASEEERRQAPKLYLAGHSAGAWLVSRVALDSRLRQRFGLDGDAIAGVISISGSGFELTDRRTWELYPKEDWWAQRFAVPEPADWREVASVVPLVASCGCGGAAHQSAQGLRFLQIYSNQDLPALARQNRLMAEALAASGLEHRVVAVSSESHRRTVMALSHPRKIVAREVLAFLATDRLDLNGVRRREVVRELDRRVADGG